MSGNVNEILMEILNEVKKISVNQAGHEARLDSISKTTDRHDDDIKQLQIVSNDTHRHGVILKGMLWVYGIIVTGVLGKFISDRMLH